jgi:tol-pal system protein YbgF
MRSRKAGSGRSLKAGGPVRRPRFAVELGLPEKSAPTRLSGSAGLGNNMIMKEGPMKPFTRPVAFMCLAAAVSFFAGCAGSVKTSKTASQAVLPEIDVIQVKENSEEALKLAQETKLDVDVLSNKSAEIDNKLVGLSEEVSNVSLAKIEEIENRLSLLIEAFKDLQAQVTAIQNAPAPKYAKPASAAPATFSPSAASSILSNSPEYDLYQNALRTFNSRNYDAALKLFAEVLRQYPQGAYADNCRYWSGECYFAIRDFASAIASFKKVFEHKNSSKADEAQLKIGMSYLKMGQPALAKTELKTLIDRYPASEYVPRAKKYLSEIK